MNGGLRAWGDERHMDEVSSIAAGLALLSEMLACRRLTREQYAVRVQLVRGRARSLGISNAQLVGWRRDDWGWHTTSQAAPSNTGRKLE